MILRLVAIVRVALVAALLCAAPGLPGSARAVTPLVALETSPETTVGLGGAVLGPDEVGEDDLDGTVIPTGPGVALPAGANLDAFARFPDGDVLLSTDVTVDLGSGVVAGPGDVAILAAGTPSIVFSSSAAGIAPGARVDAVAREMDGSLLLSFDVTVNLGGLVLEDDDLARIDAVSGDVTVAFDGSAEGVAPGLDLDAAHALPGGRVLLSFDGSGIVGGVTFDDEDLLESDPATGGFELAYDGSAEHVAWAASDLDAVHATPEPDADGDGVPDTSDVCPFVADDQADTGGVGFGSAPDGIGDACQCGDVSGDGFVTTADGLLIRRALLVPPTAFPARPELCDVGGSASCTTADGLIIRRALLVPPTAAIGQVCTPALP